MLKVLLVLSGAADVAYGGALILVPVPLLALYGLEADRTSTFLARFLGGALVGFGVLALIVRDRPDAVRHPVALALVVTNALGLVVSLIEQLQPGASPLGWSIVALTLFLAVSFAVALRRTARS